MYNNCDGEKCYLAELASDSSTTFLLSKLRSSINLWHGSEFLNSESSLSNRYIQAYLLITHMSKVEFVFFRKLMETTNEIAKQVELTCICKDLIKFNRMHVPQSGTPSITVFLGRGAALCLVAL